MRSLTRTILAGALAAVLASPAGAQKSPARPALKLAADSSMLPAVSPPADTSVHPFTPSQIPLEADRTLARALELSAAGVESDVDRVLVGARALLDTLAREEHVADLSRGHLLTRRGLGDLALAWNARSRQVNEWRRTLRSSVSKLDTARMELASLAAPWHLTVAAQDSTVGADVRARTQQVLDDLGRVETVLSGRSDSLLTAELELSHAGNMIFGELQGIAAAMGEMRRDLLRIESPPLWRSLTATGRFSDESRGGVRSALPEIRWFLRGHAARVLVHALLTLLVILLTLTNGGRVQAMKDASRVFAAHSSVLQRPVAAACLVSASCIMWLYPRAPLAVYDLALILTAVPLLLLIPDLFTPELHRPARFAIGMLVLQRVTMIATVGTPGFRLVQLLFSVMGAALLWHVLRPTGPLSLREPHWRVYLRRLTWVLFGAFTIAIGSNVIGNVSLADTINAGVSLSLFLALLVYAVMQVVDIAVSAVIRIGAQESHYLAARGDRLERVVVSVVGLLSLCLWVVFSLQGFLMWQLVQQWLVAVLRASLTLGKVSISVDMVVLFLLVLYLGTQLARLISGVIELDVMGRMDLRRGVAVTIGSLLRYALIAVAFLIALAAIGIDLGNVAILGGALGVGIGFGLQNIVNNFISGLLLAFERPVGIGDTVQVGTNLGEVKEIGIRASVIRTFEGAEVIVPNSDLITKDVINWTRTGTRRRIEVAVGVAYGNDPAKVLGLLVDVAVQHPEVRGNPKPFALFTGFGESSLDFVLRAWTDSLDWLVVRSDLAVGVSSALRDAGIAIPFPQRDLHLKSVDAEALRDLRGEATQG